MQKAIIGIGLIITTVTLGWLISLPSENDQKFKNTDKITSLKDAHGLAVDRKDSTKVYIATHTGLLVMNQNGELKRVGNAKDDYMGFSAHPTNPDIFYTSGHSRSGGNLGFQKSTDGGKTWQKISKGVNGPVDFHAMAVSQADPTIIYGYYGGRLQRSYDEGKKWNIVNANIDNIIVLSTDFKNKDTVYAGTTTGIYVSQDRGDTWSKIDAINGTVTTLAVNPQNDQEITAYVQNQGLKRSNDRGKSWDNIKNYEGSLAFHITYDIQKPATMYLINQNLEIHKTIDEGQTWIKIK